jgi:3'(2'), 5'-bisphosphate nucleotidase
VTKTRTTSAAASDDAILAVCEHLALAAGKAVMDVFNGECVVAHKADASPVTVADQAAEKIILAGLRAAYPDIPCVAEEEVAQGLVPPALRQEFFLVDPLDGTKEFIRKGRDFTVNIALIRNGVPEIGVVYAPADGKLYAGRKGRAEEVAINADFTAGQRRPITVRICGETPTLVASKSHRTPETDDYISRFGKAELVSVGSSLKFCMLAAGEADHYPRFGRTMEWDTAAGDAVLRAAGGVTLTLDGKPLTYGKRNQENDCDFANPYFISRGQ